MSQERSALDATAVSLTVLLTAATMLLFARARMMSQPFFQRDGTLAAGVAAFLSEPLSPRFALAALLIAAGIALVNLRR